MKTITLIVAMARNRAIGLDGEMPWHLPGELKHFKTTTMGKAIVMGRKTWESIGRALPGRRNIVITRQQDFAAEGCDVVQSTDEAIVAAGDVDEIMVIGGSEVYALFLPVAQRLYLTRVHADVNGDAFFPVVDEDEWQLVSDEAHAADSRNEFDFSFRIYERKDRS